MSYILLINILYMIALINRFPQNNQQKLHFKQSLQLLHMFEMRGNTPEDHHMFFLLNKHNYLLNFTYH